MRARAGRRRRALRPRPGAGDGARARRFRRPISRSSGARRPAARSARASIDLEAIAPPGRVAAAAAAARRHARRARAARPARRRAPGMERAVRRADQLHARAARFSDLAMRPRDDIPGFSRPVAAASRRSKDDGQAAARLAPGASSSCRACSRSRASRSTRSTGELELGARGGRRARPCASPRSPSPTPHFERQPASAATRWRGDGPGTLDLSAVFNRADGSAASARYLPHVLDRRAARAGSPAPSSPGEAQRRARARARRPARFPVRRSGAAAQFQVTARVEKGVLDYADGLAAHRGHRRRAHLRARRAWRSWRAAARSSARGSPTCASACRASRRGHAACW